MSVSVQIREYSIFLVYTISRQKSSYDSALYQILQQNYQHRQFNSYIQRMFSSCTKAVSIFCSSLDETSLMEGISDVIVVKHKTGEFRSTNFFVCIGPYSAYTKTGCKIEVFINKILNNQISFTVDNIGYLQPSQLNSQQLQSLNLKYGKNTIEYKIEEFRISAEIYLYTDRDRLIISDVDGTLTKNDLGGLYNNYMGNDYLHHGYHDLVTGISDHGYKVVWLTMRSLPMYDFSKKYIRDNIKVEGPLLMEPEQFFHAMKKEVLKQSGNIKVNIMKGIIRAFPESSKPLVGGLGNRENDAIAYLHVGIPQESIYIIDTDSQVHKLDVIQHSLTYAEIAKEIKLHFPFYSTMNVGYF